MSNIDKRALREAAKAVGKNDWQYVYTRDLSAPGRGYTTVGGAEAIYCLNKATGGVKQSENVLRYIAAANPATVLALLDELEAKDAKIANLTAECDALREGEMGDAKHSNTRAAADIYFQLVEECEIPAGGSLVEYVSQLRECAAAGKGESS